MSELDQPRAIEIDELDQAAIDGIQAYKTTPGPARRLAPEIAEMEAGFPARGTLTEQARAELVQFERDGVRLGELLDLERERLFDSPMLIWRQTPILIADPPQLLHVFGAEPSNPTAPHAYRLNWAHVDGFAGVGSHAAPDATHGTFSASQYATGTSALSAFAGIGVRLRPNLDWCHLSVRPYVKWSGSSMLNHRDAMPSLGEKQRAHSSGAIGISVQSWDLAGGNHHVDADHYVDMWSRTELNPSGGRDYEGTSDSSTLSATFLASRQRRYSIFVYCWAYVESVSGFAVWTRASSMIACRMPFMVIEEIRL